MGNPDDVTDITADTEWPEAPDLGPTTGRRVKNAVGAVLGVSMPPGGAGTGGGFNPARTAITGNTPSNPAPSSSGGLGKTLVNDAWSILK